jgi:hypothetical protein
VNESPPGRSRSAIARGEIGVELCVATFELGGVELCVP